MGQWPEIRLREERCERTAEPPDAGDRADAPDPSARVVAEEHDSRGDERQASKDVPREDGRLDIRGSHHLEPSKRRAQRQKEPPTSPGHSIAQLTLSRVPGESDHDGVSDPRPAGMALSLALARL